MKLLEYFSLAEVTTFRCGGSARYFTEVTSLEELREVMIFIRQHSLSFFVLGGGSNILVDDDGFSGIVIKMSIKGIVFKLPEVVAHTKNMQQTVLVTAGAGEQWDDVVKLTVDEGLGGLENLSYIPGTVGAAPVQNIGAYGTDVSATIASVEVFNTETSEIANLSNLECQFNYRDSFFKKPEGKKYIITHVTFLLSRSAVVITEYKDITHYIAENNIKFSELELQYKKLREIIIAIRKHKLPDVGQYGTAGSFFKNPVVSHKHFTRLKENFPELPYFSVSNTDVDSVKIPAAWLLDKVCGFRGFRNGPVGVYKNQALVIVNFGGATTNDIKNLAHQMIACVSQKTGIILEPEVQFIGKDPL